MSDGKQPFASFPVETIMLKNEGRPIKAADECATIRKAQGNLGPPRFPPFSTRNAAALILQASEVTFVR
jgi:hypothetical protein